MVKALDSKSNGLCPRRFESCSVRLLSFFLLSFFSFIFPLSFSYSSFLLPFFSSGLSFPPLSSPPSISQFPHLYLASHLHFTLFSFLSPTFFKQQFFFSTPFLITLTTFPSLISLSTSSTFSYVLPNLLPSSLLIFLPLSFFPQLPHPFQSPFQSSFLLLNKLSSSNSLTFL